MPKTESREPTLVGVPGAARLCEVSENTIRRWVTEGVLSCERDYANRRVFRRADLEVRQRKQRAR